MVSQAKRPSTLELKNELKRLGGQAGENLFNRAKIADMLLREDSFIVGEFEGDDVKARKYLQTDYFGDLCGSMSLERLLQIYNAFPTLEEWRAAKFNLMTLSAQLKVKQKEERAAQDRPIATSDGEPERFRATKKDVAELKNTVQEVSYNLKREQKNNESLADENRRLRDENQELRLENATLKGRVQELEHLVEKDMVAV